VKNFLKVTILGVFLGILLLAVGCRSTPQQVKQDPSLAAKRALAQKQIRLKIFQGIDYFEKGELDKAQLILKEVLQQNPDHPEAVYQWRRVTQPIYCTVYSGDTLYDIARYYYNDSGKWKILAEVNNIPSADALKHYQRLLVPLLSSYQEGRDELGRIKSRFFNGDDPDKILMHLVQEGDTLKILSKQFYGRGQLSFFLADFNSLEQRTKLIPGDSLKIPIFPKSRRAETEKEKVYFDKGSAALKDRNYNEAYRQLSNIPEESPFYFQAGSLIKKCKTEGLVFYERLGDQAFKAGEPREAAKYWKMGLTLAPRRNDLKQKIEEVRALVKALEALPDI